MLDRSGEQGVEAHRRTAMHRNAPALTPNQRTVVVAVATAITFLLLLVLGALG
ncbi:hypothetical protein [Saccharomonospora azurea]|uniref:hypothetical protein n=1 Tax=Saccharomonospora azurea TaxID=40988 RepID=UPI003D8D7628